MHTQPAQHQRRTLHIIKGMTVYISNTTTIRTMLTLLLHLATWFGFSLMLNISTCSVKVAVANFKAQ